MFSSGIVLVFQFRAKKFSLLCSMECCIVEPIQTWNKVQLNKNSSGLVNSVCIVNIIINNLYLWFMQCLHLVSLLSLMRLPYKYYNPKHYNKITTSQVCQQLTTLVSLSTVLHVHSQCCVAVLLCGPAPAASSLAVLSVYLMLFLYFFEWPTRGSLDVLQ